MKNLRLFLICFVGVIYGYTPLLAQNGSTFVCTGYFIIGTNVNVVVTMRDFGNGAGSCIIQDSYGYDILNITGSTSLGVDSSGFQEYGGVVKYRTSDNYSARCSVGRIAEGPHAGRYSSSWNVGSNQKLGNVRNGHVVGFCQRY